MEEEKVKITFEDGHTVTVVGKQGPQGEPGESIEGKTGPQGERGEQGIQGNPGERGERGQKGNEGPEGEKGERGPEGKPGSPDSPEQIANKVNTLEEKIEQKTIKGLLKRFLGLEKLIRDGSKMNHGGGISKVVHDNTLTGNGTAASPLKVLGGGSTGVIIAATNSGDGQNYNLAQSPTTSVYYIIMNNGSYTADDASFPFTVSGAVLTFASPLPSDLANTLIKLICI